MATETVETTCCVVGGGPAGVMLGYLLARGGVPVTVLEKHKDFFRDFRGDTVHPSTLEVMYELGLLEEFLQLPHQKLTSVGGVLGDFAFQAAAFRRLPTHCKFVALMPQWDFLNFLSSHAAKFPAFNLRLEHEAVDLIRDSGRTTGVQAKTPSGTVDIRADLVVGCDGRHSTIRKAAGLEVIESGVPIDVLWFRISRTGNDPENLFGNINYGKALVLIPRGDYFQSGLIIRKGSFEEIQRRGLDEFRADIARIAPYLADRVAELKDWEQIKLLSVQINRLRAVASPGTALHRRRRPRHVSCGRSWHQPGDPGCRGHGEHLDRRASRGTRHRGITGARSMPARVSHTCHPVHAGPGAQAFRESIPESRTGEGAMASEGCL